MNDLVDRFHLLSASIYCGGLYALWRIVLLVCYPFVSGSIWQNVVGPLVTKRHPEFGQSKDMSRPSYLPTGRDQPLVMSWGFFAVGIDDLTNGIRDGLLLGVMSALLPEFIRPAMLALILALTFCKHAWLVSAVSGAERTDRVIWACRELLMYVGAILALEASNFYGYTK